MVEINGRMKTDIKHVIKFYLFLFILFGSILKSESYKLSHKTYLFDFATLNTALTQLAIRQIMDIRQDNEQTLLLYFILIILNGVIFT